MDLYTLVYALIMVVSTISFWLRVLRMSGPQRRVQIVGGVCMTVATALTIVGSLII